MTVEIFKPGTEQTAQKLILNDVLISEFKQSPGGAPLEEISFVYEKIEWNFASRTFCWFLPDRAECVT